MATVPPVIVPCPACDEEITVLVTIADRGRVDRDHVLHLDVDTDLTELTAHLNSVHGAGWNVLDCRHEDMTEVRDGAGNLVRYLCGECGSNVLYDMPGKAS